MYTSRPRQSDRYREQAHSYSLIRGHQGDMGCLPGRHRRNAARTKLGSHRKASPLVPSSSLPVAQAIIMAIILNPAFDETVHDLRF